MNALVLFFVVATSSVPAQSASQQALEDALRACGMASGAKVTMGVSLEHGKVKSVKPVFKNVRDAQVRECVVDVTRGYQFDLTGPERFTVVVSL